MANLSTIVNGHTDIEVGQITELSEYYSNFLRDTCIADTILDQTIDECMKLLREHSLRLEDPDNGFVNLKLNDILRPKCSFFDEPSLSVIRSLIKAKDNLDSLKTILKQSYIYDLQKLMIAEVETDASS